MWRPLTSIMVNLCIGIVFISMFMIAEVKQPRIDGFLAPLLRNIGILIMIISGLLMVAASVPLLFSTGPAQIDPKRLLTRHAYSLVRHPIYNSSISLVFGWYLARNATYAFLFFPVVLAGFCLQALYEEINVLEPKFGKKHEAYSLKIPMMFRKSQIILFLILYILVFIGWMF